MDDRHIPPRARWLLAVTIAVALVGAWLSAEAGYGVAPVSAASSAAVSASGSPS